MALADARTVADRSSCAGFACRQPFADQQEGSKKRRLLFSAIGLVVLDGVMCVVMQMVQAQDLKRGSSVFSSGVIDVILLDALRLVLLILFSCLGYWAWRRSLPQVGQSATHTRASSDVSLQGMGGSLLSSTSIDPEASGDQSAFSEETLQDEKRRVEQSKSGEARRNAAIWALFAVCSLSALYSGVKCVSFGTSNAFESSGSLLTLLIGLGVFLCHAQFYVSKQFLMTITTADGLYFPWLHPHTLYFVTKADNRGCQICRSKILGNNHGGMAYFCPLCERHFYCIGCLKKQVRQRQPSGASGDDLEEAGRQKNDTFAYMRRVLPLVRPFLHIVVLSLFVVCINQAFVIAAPKWQGSLLDSVAKSDGETFQKAIVMYLFLNIGTGLFSSIQSSAVDVVRRRLVFRTRAATFQHIMKQDIAYFDSNLAGQITSRLTTDANQMSDPVSTIMNNVVSNVIKLAGGLFMCFHTSWKLSILAMTAIFPITYLVRSYSEWAGKIARKIMDEMSEANGTATQAISNMRTVRYFGAESFELERYEKNLNNVYKLQRKDNVTRIANGTLTSYLDLGVGVFVLWYGGSVIIAGDDSHFSLGQLITFQLYWNMMKTAFNGLNSVLSSLMRATSASQRILDLLDLNPTIETGRGIWLEHDAEYDGTIRMENVTFSYSQKRSQKPVLSNVSLVLPGGKMTAIVGKSGSGKSTMGALLLRLYDPIEGRICLDGREFCDIQPQSLRSQFGVVSQETQLFAGTVEDNIAYAMVRAYTSEDLEAAAAKANALEFIDKCEDRFQTLVGDRGMLLSGGQKQRVSIARMFLRRPRLLLLDEATSALDAENEKIVQDALDDLVDSGLCRTVAVIAHRLSTVRNADQIVVMEDGEIKELGTHDELLELSTGIYAQLVQRQLHGKGDNDSPEKKSPEKSPKKSRAHRADRHSLES